MDKKQILHLTLHREWFDAMARGEKDEEYRANTTYWAKRLTDRVYDEVWFTNGYDQKTRPFMRRVWLGHDFREVNGDLTHVIKLGEILELKHWNAEHLTTLPVVEQVCGTCRHHHKLVGYDRVWCEDLKRFTLAEALSCGGWEPLQPQASLTITRDGYTLEFSDGVDEVCEKWTRSGMEVVREAGDLEQEGLDERLSFALLCLASEAEHVMRTLPEARALVEDAVETEAA